MVKGIESIKPIYLEPILPWEKANVDGLIDLLFKEDDYFPSEFTVGDGRFDHLGLPPLNGIPKIEGLRRRDYMSHFGVSDAFAEAFGAWE